MKITKKRYLQGFAIVVIILGMVRCVFPQVAYTSKQKSENDSIQKASSKAIAKDSGLRDTITKTKEVKVLPIDTIIPLKNGASSKFFNSDGTLVKNRIFSVPNFERTFPDQNDVQLIAAQREGVRPVEDRNDAESRKSELVYVGANPYYYIDRSRYSIPYLVPSASNLLQDIGRNFYDSLAIKGVPLHKIIVTSVMRTQSDVSKLRSHNSNATQNSCHMYGTTFDVAYNRYKTVEAPGENLHKVRNDTLKWILSEVLNDMHKQNRCYVKYEVHQGCFHITVR
jgi:hypothetical protein